MTVEYMRCKGLRIVIIIMAVGLFPLMSCASRGAIKAEEYFSIGMAYYDMGKYAEAEQWLNRAKAADRTMTASEYNLGRIAFETGRYEEAALNFESILKRDPENIMALKSAAYSRIKNGDLGKAEELYIRVIALVPDNVDDGYNYALVLYGVGKYEECENVLNKYRYSLDENAHSALLLARAQKALDRIEAADSYAKWLSISTGVNAQGLYEYAQVLESAELYARALEQYRDAINANTNDSGDLKNSTIRFERARLLLTADPENPEGLAELSTAVNEGFSNDASIEDLLNDGRIKPENREEIRNILNSMLGKNEEAEIEEEKEVDE